MHLSGDNITVKSLILLCFAIQQMVSAVLQAGKRSQEAGVTIARQFSEVIHALLLVVPMNSILAVSDTVMAHVDEEDEDMQPEASSSGASGQCYLPYMLADLTSASTYE